MAKKYCPICGGELSYKSADLNDTICLKCNKTPDYQQRVIVEKTELDLKIIKLAKFLNTSTYKELPETSRSLLMMQMRIMNLYSDILAMRILSFQL